MLLAVLATGGCGRDEGAGIESGSESGGVLVSDLTADLEAEVLARDRQLSERVGVQGLAAWVEAFAEDGAVLPADGPVTRGRRSIEELFGPAFADPEFRFDWAPLGADVAESGDLAVTYGEYRTRVGGADISGRYVTVWKRQADGSWKIALDIGNRSSPS